MKKFGRSTTVSADVDLDLAAAVERHAEEEDVSKASIVRNALREYLTKEMKDDVELIDYEIKQREGEIRELEQEKRTLGQDLEEKRAELNELRGGRDDVIERQVDKEAEELFEQAEPDID